MLLNKYCYRKLIENKNWIYDQSIWKILINTIVYRLNIKIN